MAFCNHDDDLASSKPYQDRKMEVLWGDAHAVLLFAQDGMEAT